MEELQSFPNIKIIINVSEFVLYEKKYGNTRAYLQCDIHRKLSKLIDRSAFKIRVSCIMKRQKLCECECIECKRHFKMHRNKNRKNEIKNCCPISKL